MISTRFGLSGLLCLVAFAPQLGAQTEPKAPNPLTTALWFTHHFAEPDALTPDKDRRLKTKLIAAFRKSKELPWAEVSDYFDRATRQKLSGDGNTLTVDAMERLIGDKTPQSRKDMHPKVRTHADLLTTQFDLIEEQHRKPAAELVAWVVKNYKPGKPLGIIAVCTGNTRRSMLSATMGNVAASYYGLTDLKFYSGGTDPDAFNPRTITALKEIGVRIEPTGREATRGKTDQANPIYSVEWGRGLETVEFSKKYTDAQNPKEGFAAIMVCSEADTACPKVEGANVRIPVPYLDPKAFDGAPFEAAKYAERRDDIGRFMLCVMMQARRQLEQDGKLK